MAKRRKMKLGKLKQVRTIDGVMTCFRNPFGTGRTTCVLGGERDARAYLREARAMVKGEISTYSSNSQYAKRRRRRGR